MDEWMAALGLALIFEGLVPFLFPEQWRSFVQRVAQLAGDRIRTIGMVAVLSGVALLFFAR
jgi:uncharacterized protein